jgi:CRISPR type III-B/RAMP module RAMP protein Cmr6
MPSVDGIQNLELQLFTYLDLPKNSQEGAWRTEHLRAVANPPDKWREEVLSALGPLSRRRRAFFEAAGARHLRLVLTDEYTCGLSHDTLLQNAMTVLPPWGVPVVTAEGQKGILRHWLASLLVGTLTPPRDAADGALHDHGLLGLFDAGSTGRGAIAFFDAWPAYDGGFALRVTGTTAHHQSWYRGGDDAVPDGIENPNPIPMLAVRRGTTYDFAWAVSDDNRCPPCHLSKDQTANLTEFDIPESTWSTRSAFVQALFLSAARYHGFGARTNVGHGRFQPPATP